MGRGVRIAICGSTELSREGLRALLAEQGLTVAATSARAEDLLDIAGEIEIALLQGKSSAEALQACAALREGSPTLKIVLIVEEARSTDQIASAFHSGLVDGYLRKDMPVRSLASALNLVAMGEKVFPVHALDALPRYGSSPRAQLNGSSDLSVLSEREVDILRCLIRGEPNKAISRRLGIADATVKVHIKGMLSKLRLLNRTQAAIWAVAHGVGRADPAAIAGTAPASSPANRLAARALH